MGVIQITGNKMGTTNLTITSKADPNVTTTVPVTVKSNNLLAYGPAEANNLKAAVAADGSLDLASIGDVEPGKGVQWVLDLSALAGRTVTLSYEGDIPSAMVVSLEGTDATIWQGTNDKQTTLPADTTTVALNLFKGGVSAGPVSGNIRITLNEGTQPLPWMRPDVTTLQGGGSQMNDMWPAFAAATSNGVTLTPIAAGGYTVAGTPTAWTAWTMPVTLTPGTYLMAPDVNGKGVEAAVYPGDPASTTKITGVFDVAEAGEWTARIFTDAPGTTVDATLRPHLYRIG